MSSSLINYLQNEKQLIKLKAKREAALSQKVAQ